MTLRAYELGKIVENSVKEALINIGCYVDHWSDNHFKYPFKFKSQKGIKKSWSDFNIHKIPDFKSCDYIIEVKSISESTKNLKQSNKKLIGDIMVEYKQYMAYFEKETRHRNKEIIYYVLVGPCDKDLILEHLSEYRSWYWMKDKFNVVYLDELIEILRKKIEIYNNNLVAA